MSEPRVDSLSVELRGLISEDGFCMNGLHIFFHLLQTKCGVELTGVLWVDL